MHILSRAAPAVLLACAALGATGDRAVAQGAPPAPAVGVTEVRSQPVTSVSQFIGRIQAVDSVALVARVTAFLERRLFTEGADVKKGDLLYVLEQGPFQAQVLAQQGALAQAQANIRYASLSLQRQQALLHTPAGQQSNLDNAVATAKGNAGAVLTAQGNLQSAQINLAYTEIRAPVDGRITETAVNEGNVVSPTSGTLATIVTQDPMYVEFPVATRDVVTLQKKYAALGGLGAARVHVMLTNGDTYDKAGKLDYVSPTVAANTDTIPLRATIANPERGGGDQGGVGSRQLVNGEFVTVQITDPHPVMSMIVPSAAVLSDQQGNYVFTLDAQNKAQRSNVKLGPLNGAQQVVESGLREGDRVIVDGVQRVHAGLQVQPEAPQAVVADPSEAPPASGPAKGQAAPAEKSGAAQNGNAAPPATPGTTPNRQ
ncbi:efflux RND transporter periplasmic adaptor subunit [Lichenicoccus sp.]|uniref:efflux RND transporter periplasmic adaptor subunit n=1 Tax=Lichenicoccus sp. TaxID=2781899 RepID=UPI003D1101E8